MMERRAFVMSALAAIAAAPDFATAYQQPEVPTFRADVPPGATLWGLAVFTADEPIELVLAAGKEIKTIRGQFGGRRLTEYSWRNTKDAVQPVAIRAKAMAGDRELPPTRIQFLSEQNVYVAFGRRGTPTDRADRRGGYPYEVIFAGFIVYDT